MFSSSTETSTPTKAAGVSVQTSVEGKGIGIVYGRQRISPNLIWMGDFKAEEQTQDYGMCGGGGSATSYLYSVSFIMGICEGPVELVAVFKGTTSDDGEEEEEDPIYTFSGGDRPQAAWGYLESSHEDELVYYPGIAWAAWQSRDLGSSASLPNYSFEIDGFCQGVENAPDAVDVDPALAIYDFITNPYYGAGIPDEAVDSFYDYSDFCMANDLLVSIALTDRSEGRSCIETLIELTNAAAVWKGTRIEIIPYGDSSVTGNGVTFTPIAETGVELGLDDFLVSDDNEGPVKLKRANRADAYNSVRLEVEKREKQYNSTVVEAHSQLSINTWGYRPEDTQTAHFFCTEDRGRLAAQLRLQRIQNMDTYEFKLGWKWIVLEPMDIVRITDPFLCLDRQKVRITEIEEDEEGALNVKAEAVEDGLGTAYSYNTQATSAFTPGSAGAPGSVNAPIIFEPPSGLSLGEPTLIFCVSGADGSDWGGCQVWASLDGDTYSYIGTIGSPVSGSTRLGGSARQGVTAAVFPAGSDPDTTNSLSVDMSMSGRTVSAATQAQADAYESLAYLGGELIATTAAALQEDGTYLLSGYIRRGLYDTAIASHAAGTKFATLGSSDVAKYSYPTTWIGSTVTFKFRSFNIFGAQLQDLEDCTAYSLAVAGDSYYSAEDNDYWVLRSDGDWEPKA